MIRESKLGHYPADSSRATHAAEEAVDSCRYMAALIVGALRGETKEALLGGVFEPVPGVWDEQPLVPTVKAIAGGSFMRREPPRLSGSGGYVIPSLEIALWAFYHSENFRDGALLAVNLGYDADTYGAIYGQLAGAYYGESGMPEEWREIIAKRDLLISYADSLHSLRMAS